MLRCVLPYIRLIVETESFRYTVTSIAQHHAVKRVSTMVCDSLLEPLEEWNGVGLRGTVAEDLVCDEVYEHVDYFLFESLGWDGIEKLALEKGAEGVRELVECLLQACARLESLPGWLLEPAGLAVEGER